MIQVDRLTKYFGHVLAVNNVSFQVEKNEIVGLLGNNGAGKTTIMRILTTYLPASSGVARVDGFDVMKDSMEVRRRIGYLPENIPLYGEMRVDEYLDFRAKLKGVERRRRGERLGYCVERCRLEGVRRALLGTLSKGYRQRVGLADALIADPPLLVLDEPTDGLDPGQKQETLGRPARPRPDPYHHAVVPPAFGGGDDRPARHHPAARTPGFGEKAVRSGDRFDHPGGSAGAVGSGGQRPARRGRRDAGDDPGTRRRPAFLRGAHAPVGGPARADLPRGGQPQLAAPPARHAAAPLPGSLERDQQPGRVRPAGRGGLWRRRPPRTRPLRRP